jgi:hypothetical protein
MVIAKATLKVMGARFNRSIHRAYRVSRELSAFDATTGQPIYAEWKYASDTQWVLASTWRDDQPQLPLQVRTAEDALTLNPANIIGNGVDLVGSGSAAFVACRDNGDVVGWGYGAFGASIPGKVAALDDIAEVSCTRAAYTARRNNGKVVAWGREVDGATMSAFAARRRNGQVVAWGDPSWGGQVPRDIAELDDIVQLCESTLAFSALRKNGVVVAWGDAKVGGDTSAVVEQLINVLAIYGNTDAFTALTGDGRVVTWGHPDGGGDSSAVQGLLEGKVSYHAKQVSEGLGMALEARL